jgi:chromate transport protein ChrA
VTPWLLLLAYLVWTGVMLRFAATRRTRALGLTAVAAALLFAAFVALGLGASDRDSDGTTLFGVIILVAVAGPWLLGSVLLAFAVRGGTALLDRNRERRGNKAEGTT